MHLIEIPTPIVRHVFCNYEHGDSKVRLDGGVTVPHAGLMNEREMAVEEGALLRARLHIRGGKRRLRQGKISAGIVTLADAVSAAMEWYLASRERKEHLHIMDEDNLNDEGNVHAVLVRSGVVDETFDYDAFDGLVEKALGTEMDNYDPWGLMPALDSFMTQMGVLPFDENTLPPEDPSTF